MRNKTDHTVLIAICVLLGVVFTVTLWILGSVYNNGKNVDRDKYLFTHCQKIGAVQNGWGGTNYKCGNQ